MQYPWVLSVNVLLRLIDDQCINNGRGHNSLFSNKKKKKKENPCVVSAKINKQHLHHLLNFAIWNISPTTFWFPSGLARPGPEDEIEKFIKSFLYISQCMTNVKSLRRPSWRWRTLTDINDRMNDTTSPDLCFIIVIHFSVHLTTR